MKLSILTINRNNLSGLTITLNGIFKQTYTDFESIIIDGNSSDGSAELINKNKDKFSYSVSEPDSGIYNAMNKGILQAHGEYILFLNSGDCLAGEHVLSSVFDKQPVADIFTGDVLIPRKGSNEEIWRAPEKFDLQTALMSGLAHPGSFIKRELFQKYGLYNENRKIVADWEFFLKAIIINKSSYSRIPVIVSVFDDTGISTKNKVLDEEEKWAVLSQYYSPEVLDLILEYRSLKTDHEKYLRNGLVQTGKYLSGFSIPRKLFNRAYSIMNKKPKK